MQRLIRPGREKKGPADIGPFVEREKELPPQISPFPSCLEIEKLHPAVGPSLPVPVERKAGILAGVGKETRQILHPPFFQKTVELHDRVVKSQMKTDFLRKKPSLLNNNGTGRQFETAILFSQVHPVITPRRQCRPNRRLQMAEERIKGNNKKKHNARENQTATRLRALEKKQRASPRFQGMPFFLFHSPACLFSSFIPRSTLFLCLGLSFSFILTRPGHLFRLGGFSAAAGSG